MYVLQTNFCVKAPKKICLIKVITKINDSFIWWKDLSSSHTSQSPSWSFEYKTVKIRLHLVNGTPKLKSHYRETVKVLQKFTYKLENKIKNMSNNTEVHLKYVRTFLKTKIGVKDYSPSAHKHNKHATNRIGVENLVSRWNSLKVRRIKECRGEQFLQLWEAFNGTGVTLSHGRQRSVY